MIGVQKQQKQKKVPYISQQRTPLNVVVEKIGTRAVVHGDLSKENLKELLMSELSLVTKFQSPETTDSMTSLEKKSLTRGISEIITKGDKENISKESQFEEEEGEFKTGKDGKVEESEKEKQELKSAKDQMKIVKASQEKDKDFTNNEFQKSQKDIFENVVKKKGGKDQDIENKNRNDEEVQESNEEQNYNKGKEKIVSNKEDSSSQGKVGKVTKRGDTKDEDKEKDFGNDIKIAEEEEKQYHGKEKVSGKYEGVEERGEKQNEETETTKKEFDKKGQENKNLGKVKSTTSCQSDKRTSRQTENILQEKRKKEEADCSVKYLFRRKDAKAKGKQFMSEKEKRERGRAIIKGKDSRHYDSFYEMKQIDKISDTEDFTEDYEKKERESCFSKISSAQEDILTLSYDGKWLRQYLRKPLILAMKEIIEKEPIDPVNYLGFWLLNYRNCQENLQRKKQMEKELLSKRNEWSMLHDQVKETPELIIEEKESKHQEEEENIEDWDYLNYGFR